MARGPWPVGTLIAYRIMTSDADSVRNSKLWNKYVLLRVVKVEDFFGTGKKTMAICLYDWIGDEIPDAEIAKNLSFTHFSILMPQLTGKALQLLDNCLSTGMIGDRQKGKMISNISKPSVCTFELLCSTSGKGVDTKSVFTILEHDPSFEENTPAIFYENTGGISMTHCRPLDITLVKRFSEKADNF